MTSSSADGYTAVVKRYTSGYSSASKFNTDVPKPEPVPTKRKKRINACFGKINITYLILSHWKKK